MSSALLSKSNLSFVALALVATTFSACNRGPAAVLQPSISPSGAGSKAMEMYDKDGDGKVAEIELDQAPALKAALGNLDTNGDKGVSADEIAARVNAWKAMETGMTAARCRITLDGQPLEGADVTFEPESFLGEEVKAAIGKTNQFGDVSPSIPKEQRPRPDLPGGANFGLYKVRISRVVNGKETIPSKYNTATILGHEVSYDDPEMKGMLIRFTLKSN